MIKRSTVHQSKNKVLETDIEETEIQRDNEWKEIEKEKQKNKAKAK